MSQVLAIRPFVPAADVAISRRFYQSLGFRVTHQDDTVTVLKMGDCSFILSKSHAETRADNAAVQMLVRDVELWWKGANPDRLVAEFGVRPPVAPVLQPWGLKVGFISDPVGVLWHIAEVPF